LTHVTITEYAVAGRDPGPYAITTGPDGALWTALKIGALARIAPARDEA
jgi:virginiamycin B lyase